MTSRRIPALSLAAALVASVGLACAQPDRVARPAAVPSLNLLGGGSASLFLCPGSAPKSASALVTPLLGGTVSAGGFSIALPAGAVLAPTTITVTVPASPYLEVDIRADGAEHYQFAQPAVVTMDYSRCGVAAAEARLTVLYIDAATKTPLEDMGGVDDKLTRRITFVTPHLSGYALANRTDTTGTSGVGGE
jgi:hypothetical protein